MDFTHTKSGKYYVVEVSGRLDATTYQEFEEQCDDWLKQDETHIIVDMNGVDYISSAGLRSILTSAKKTRSRGGDIYFCCLNGMVSEVFTMSGFASMFKIFESRELAAND
jgi:anti-sigma B factor antagonist